MNPKIAVLIPCYNEEKTIGKVVCDWAGALPDADIYVYDNHSEDHTADIAAKNGAIVRHESAKGKGNVVRRMFMDVDADCYIMVDGDDTYPAECGPELTKKILQEKKDMVIGDRLSTTYFSENKKPANGFGNRLICFLINLMFHAKVPDVMSGCRAFSRNFIKSFPAISKEFETETEMTIFALKHHLAIDFVPIRYRDRPNGSQSKIRFFHDGVRILWMFGKLSWNL